MTTGRQGLGPHVPHFLPDKPFNAMHPFGVGNTSQKWPFKTSREEGYQWNIGIPTKPQRSHDQGSKIKTPQTSLLWFKERGCRPLMAWGMSLMACVASTFQLK